MVGVCSRSPEWGWMKPFCEQQVGLSQAQVLVAVGNFNCLTSVGMATLQVASCSARSCMLQQFSGYKGWQKEQKKIFFGFDWLQGKELAENLRVGDSLGEWDHEMRVWHWKKPGHFVNYVLLLILSKRKTGRKCVSMAKLLKISIKIPGMSKNGKAERSRSKIRLN